MSKQPKSRPAPSFSPVKMRARRDGWTSDKQVRFIETLAESACVEEACAAVGMTRQSAYRLRMRPDAQAFRLAWDTAQDLSIRRLSDACYSRALKGEPVPHFYRGEQVGEHRRYDNRLAMFLLRYRDPLRYAATLDQMVYTGHAEQAPLAFARALNRCIDAAHGLRDEPPEEGAPHPAAPPFATIPVQHERARQHEQAIIAGDAPIGGDHARRQRLGEARAAHAARNGADRPMNQKEIAEALHWHMTGEKIDLGGEPGGG